MVGFNKIRLGFILCVLNMSANLAWAQSASEFIWDNYQGFLPASSCSVEPSATAEIEVAREEVRLLDKNGKSWLLLRGGSLVKAKEGAKDKKIGGKTFKAIRLVGVPRESELLNSQDYALKGISMAYFPETFFSRLENYEIMITGELTMEKVPTVTKVGALSLDLKGSIWRVAMEKGMYVRFRCGEKLLTVFEVYSPYGHGPYARVGVDKDGTRIFNNIDTRKIKDDAPPVVVDAPVPAEQRPKPAPAPAPAPTVDVPLPRVRPKELADAALAARNAAKAAEIAVCSVNATAIIRKDGTDDPDETFEIPWGERIVPIPVEQFTPRFIELGKNKFEYWKVNFPDRKVESERVGWIAKVYIVSRGACTTKPVVEESLHGATASIEGGNFKGATCSRNDTSRLKCMICAIHWEAALDSYEGMVAVGRVVMKRVASPKWPKTVCKVAYQSGQFVGLKSGKRITKDSKTYNRLHRAAQEAIRLGPGKFIGFRTCSYSRRGTNIGGNCFRTTASIDMNFGLDGLVQTANLNKEPVLDNLVEVATEEELNAFEETPPLLRKIGN